MKKLVVTTMAVFVFGVTSYVGYPWVLGQVKDRHPVAYVRYVESRLAQDLETMNKARFRLGTEVERLSAQNSKLSAKVQRARSLANDFRVAYQELEQSGQDAAVVHDCAYTKAQMFSQVSLLLAEAEGYRQSQEELAATLARGEQQMEQYAVQIGKTESQLAILATKRELIRLQDLTVEGQELLAEVDQLMIENAQAVACSPVRPSWEIEDDTHDEASKRKVEEYLAAEPEQVATAIVAACVVEVREETKIVEANLPPAPQSTNRSNSPKIDDKQPERAEVPPAPRPPARTAKKNAEPVTIEVTENTPIFKQSVSQK